jgi:hypothetical protein
MRRVGLSPPSGAPGSPGWEGSSRPTLANDLPVLPVKDEVSMPADIDSQDGKIMSDREEQSAERNAAFRKKQAEFRQLVDSIQGYEPRDKAEAWLEFVAQNPNSFGDQEALVYLRSRGRDCSTEIDKLVSFWKRCAEERIEECTHGQVIENSGGDGGKTEHHSGPPLPEARDVKKHSQLALRNFWNWHLGQRYSIDATMLRTVDWCEIGGFEGWWERMAQSHREYLLRWGMEPFGLGAAWLFCMCRSD